MRSGNIKLFLNPERLDSLIQLRKNGWGIYSLSVFFNCDPSSIRYQIYKNNLSRRDGVYSVNRIVNVALRAGIIPANLTNVYILDGELINKGRNYADYLKEYPPTKRA